MKCSKVTHVGFVRIVPQLSKRTPRTLALNKVQYHRDARVGSPVLDVAGETRDPKQVDDLAERLSSLVPRLKTDVRVWPVMSKHKYSGFRVRLLRNSTRPVNEYE